ncbi:MAG: UDP-N-acetylglucosamine--N-acetylmuramyl-(pentapeptide) pyrophosphoryl-undecaprenol N-acetylglucosamine transferase [Tissierellia bacterium]|nr:UDP-N-acetylglucosamine--N-acetylmuramyl-(pentapeptide) pyrophosphoryl-undecaprenol N-acetylglucosamine transferase [Tissierellia bacterium]
MKFLVAAGGSGGHIFPGQAIVQAIKSLEPKAEFIWVGTEEGKERDIAKLEGIPYVPIRAWSVNNEGLIWKIQAYWFHSLMTLKLIRLLKKEKVDAVITTGGFTTASSLMAASILKVPIFMHEQNVYPGLGTRMFGKHAKIIFTSFPGSEKHLEGLENKIRLLGNPVRKEFSRLTYEKARQELGINDELLVLSVGGSLGSRNINDFIRSISDDIEVLDNVIWIHVVGMDYEEELEFYKDKKRIKALCFLQDLPRYLAATDLLITRSGASTITEISVLGKASVLIPSKNVLDDHQTMNARVYTDNNAAILIEDDRLQDQESKEIIFELLNNDKRRRELAKNSRGLAPQDSALKIAQEILESL